MDGILQDTGGARAFPWRRLAWGTAIALMLAAAMAKLTVPGEFQWTAGDFAAAALLLAVPCLGFELALRMARGNTCYILASALALGTAFLTAWINLAVGIIGDEDDPANWAFVAVLGLALAGAVLARLRAAGLARALLVAGLAQVAVAAYARSLSSPEGLAISLVFAAAWCLAAWFFHLAARQMAASV